VYVERRLRQTLRPPVYTLLLDPYFTVKLYVLKNLGLEYIYVAMR